MKETIKLDMGSAIRVLRKGRATTRVARVEAAIIAELAEHLALEDLPQLPQW